MIEITGPSNNFIFFDKETSKFKGKSPLFHCEVSTLGEAIERYCEHFKSSVKPYDGDKSSALFSDGTSLFLIYDDPNTRFRNCLVRVTVSRGSTIIQKDMSLAMPLEDGDKIDMGTPGC